jgi:tetratricopeptide (TPR) repeat protein
MDYTQVLRIYPDSAVAYTSRGIAHYYNDAYDEAVADLSRANSIDPDYPIAKQNLEIILSVWGS